MLPWTKLCSSRFISLYTSCDFWILSNAAVSLQLTFHLRKKDKDGHHSLGHGLWSADFPTHTLFGLPVAFHHQWAPLWGERWLPMAVPIQSAIFPSSAPSLSQTKTTLQVPWQILLRKGIPCAITPVEDSVVFPLSSHGIMNKMWEPTWAHPPGYGLSRGDPWPPLLQVGLPATAWPRSHLLSS